MMALQLIPACVLLLLSAAYASPEIMATGNRRMLSDSSLGKKIKSFKVKLAGSKTTDAKGYGKAEFTLYRSSDGDYNLKYKAAVEHLQGTMPPTKFHIHQGDSNTKGPLKINIDSTWKKSKDYYVTYGVAKRLSKLKTEDGKSSWKSVFSAISKKPDQYYVNIHTVKYPDGAVRGQFYFA